MLSISDCWMRNLCISPSKAQGTLEEWGKECKTWNKEKSVVEYYFLAWHELTATAISCKRPVQDGAHQEGGSGRGITRPQASLMSYWQLPSARVRGYIFFTVVDTAKMSMFL